MPLIWVVLCEVFFLVYVVRDDGVSFDPARMIRRLWPMARILFLALFGGIVGLLFFGFFGPVARWFGLFVGAMPAAVMADRLLCRIRPATRIWRWAAGAVLLAQGLALGVSFGFW